MKAALYAAIAICLLTTGCWDKVELENRGFVVSIGLDKSNAAEKKKYTATVVMPNVTGAKDDVITDKAKLVKSADDVSVSGAFRLIDAISSQKLYLKQAKMLVIGEGLLKEENLLRQAMDAIERNSEISGKMFLIAGKTQARSILSAPLDNEPMLGIFMENYYRNNRGGGSVLFRQSLQQTITELRSSGDTVIPMLEIKDGAEEKIKLTGCAVIKNYKLAGYLDAVETRGYQWVMGDCRGAEIIIEHEEKILPLRIKSSRSKTRLWDNAGLQCDWDINVVGNLDAYSFTEPLVFAETLAARFEQAIADEVRQTAHLLQEQLQVDAYHLLERLYKDDVDLHKLYAKDWEQVFCEIKIVPHVHVKITGTGSLR